MHEIVLSRTEEILNRISAEKGRPFSGTFELLPLCNMNCDMCYVHMSSKECYEMGGLKPVEWWLAMGNQVAEAGVLNLLLTGGEPLIYPGFRDLYIGLKKKGLILSINTNAVLLDQEWAEFFCKNKPRRVNITLYGASDEAYCKLCHCPGGYDRVIEAIRMLKNRQVDVRMNITVTPQNVDDLENMLALAKEMDIPVVVDTYIQPIQRDRNVGFSEMYRLSPEKAAMAQFIRNKYDMSDEAFLDYAKRSVWKIEHYIPTKELQSMTCNAGASSFVIDWQGNIRACLVMSPLSIATTELGFEKSWEILKERTKEIKLNVICVQCKLRPLCRTCVGNAFCETKKADGVPDYICKMTEAYVSLLKQYILKESLE